MIQKMILEQCLTKKEITCVIYSSILLPHRQMQRMFLIPFLTQANESHSS